MAKAVGVCEVPGCLRDVGHRGACYFDKGEDSDEEDAYTDTYDSQPRAVLDSADV